MNILPEIIKEWARCNPSRARGGQWALSGFYYQFAESLRSFFEPVSQGGVPHFAAFEGISDLSRETATTIDFIEYKKVLNKRSLGSAITSFVAIDVFLQDLFPLRRGHASFRVVTSSNTSDIDNALPADEQSRERWLDIVRAGRYLGVDVRPDPWLELFKMLWPLVRRPASLIDELLQAVFEQASSGTLDATRLSRELVRLYEADLRPNKRLNVPWVTHADLNRRDIIPRRVLTGQRPTLEDFRTGAFMERPKYQQEIHSAIQRASESEAHASPRHRIPIIWLVGGSGVGKSSILVQSVASVLDKLDFTCGYLRGSPTEILSAMKGRPDGPVLLAIDDLFSPLWRDPQQWSHIVSLSRTAATKMIWIATGPIESLEAFRRRSAHVEVFQDHVVRVTPLSDTEREDSYHWLNARTAGLRQALGRPLDDTNFVVAAFKYLIYGKLSTSLDEFVSRLWDRLDEIGLSDPISLTMACARVGLDAPEALFGNAASRDALHRFLDGNLIISRILSEGGAPYGFRLRIHRRLADVIYTARYANDLVWTRAAHLLSLWKVLDDTSRRGLLLVLERGGDYVSRDVVAIFLVDLAKHFYEEFYSSDYHWVYLDLWCKCAARQELSLSQRHEGLGWLVETLNGRAAIPDQYVGSAISAAWGLVSATGTFSKEDLVRLTVGWLRDTESDSFWGILWKRVWFEGEDYVSKNDLIELALAWLGENVTTKIWFDIVQHLLDSGIRDASFADQIRTGLRIAPPSPVELYVLEKSAAIIGYDDVRALAVERVLKQRNGFLVERLKPLFYGVGPSCIFAQLRYVTVERADDIGAGSAISMLLDVLDYADWSVSHEVTPLHSVLEWLKSRESAPDWPFVWQRLIDSLRNLPDGSLLEQQNGT